MRSIQISARDLTRWNEVFRVQTAAGARWIRGEAVPARYLSMGTVWNGILFDVSDQKSAQEQLEKLTHDFTAKIDELVKKKEAEVMAI